MIEALDTGIGPIKARARGVTGGELVAGLAQCQLLGGKFVTAVDRHRTDVAAQLLSAVTGVASTTAGGLTRCFGPARVAGIEARGGLGGGGVAGPPGGLGRPAAGDGLRVGDLPAEPADRDRRDPMPR